MLLGIISRRRIYGLIGVVILLIASMPMILSQAGVGVWHGGHNQNNNPDASVNMAGANNA